MPKGVFQSISTKQMTKKNIDLNFKWFLFVQIWYDKLKRITTLIRLTLFANFNPMENLTEAQINLNEDKKKTKDIASINRDEIILHKFTFSTWSNGLKNGKRKIFSRTYFGSYNLKLTTKLAIYSGKTNWRSNIIRILSNVLYSHLDARRWFSFIRFRRFKHFHIQVRKLDKFLHHFGQV